MGQVNPAFRRWRGHNGEATPNDVRPLVESEGSGEARSVSDVKSRLETIRVCTDSSIDTLMAYWLIHRVAHHLCSAAPKLFWRPYYNTPLMPMLRAHADAQVVRIHAVLCGTSLCNTCSAAGKKQTACANGRCGKALSDGLSLRGLGDLKNHRDVLGHPLTFQLDRPAVRKFVDDKRDIADVRPALVWDIHRSIVGAQIAAAVSGAAVLDVTIRPYQIAVLESILRLCLKPDVPSFGDVALAEWMTEFWKKDRAEFEKYPDGQLPRKTKAELAAIYAKNKKEWEDSR
jgi:hypothetical protein